MGWLDGGVGVLPVVVGVLVVDGLVVNSGKGVKGSKGNFEKSRLVKADPGIFLVESSQQQHWGVCKQ